MARGSLRRSVRSSPAVRRARPGTRRRWSASASRVDAVDGGESEFERRRGRHRSTTGRSRSGGRRRRSRSRRRMRRRAFRSSATLSMTPIIPASKPAPFVTSRSAFSIASAWRADGAKSCGSDPIGMITCDVDHIRRWPPRRRRRGCSSSPPPSAGRRRRRPRVSDGVVGAAAGDGEWRDGRRARRREWSVCVSSVE